MTEYPSDPRPAPPPYDPRSAGPPPGRPPGYPFGGSNGHPYNQFPPGGHPPGGRGANGAAVAPPAGGQEPWGYDPGRFGPPAPPPVGYEPPQYDPRDFDPRRPPPGQQAEHAGPAGGGRGALLLLVPLLIGSLVAVSLGVYGNLHEPTGIAVNLAGFSGPLAAKAWVTCGVLFFALVQVVSALIMYGRIPGLRGGAGIAVVHRWSGRIAFLLAVPVAVHCLYAVGFASSGLRPVLHSVLGCAFFGAFVVKMLGLRREGLPGWALPVLGGVLFSGLVGLWWTSSLWYFTTFGAAF